MYCCTVKLCSTTCCDSTLSRRLLQPPLLPARAEKHAVQSVDECNATMFDLAQENELDCQRISAVLQRTKGGTKQRDVVKTARSMQPVFWQMWQAHRSRRWKLPLQCQMLRPCSSTGRITSSLFSSTSSKWAGHLPMPPRFRLTYHIIAVVGGC